MKNGYSNEIDFYIKSYNLGHSQLILRSMDSQNIEIVFEGVEYFELTRIYRGIQIQKLSNDEQIELVNKRAYVKSQMYCAWKIESRSGVFYVLGFAVKVLVDKKVVYWDHLKL